MGRQPLILIVLLTACSGVPREDLEYIKQARSIAAEWALVNQQAQEDRVTATYVKTMREWLRNNLRTSYSSLTQPNSSYGAEIRALLAEPPNAAADRLEIRADKLKQIEDKLESS